MNFKCYQHKRPVHAFKKKKKELNIWSIAEVFSLAVLHLPRVSCAFASTPGCESCAWSVNAKTFHYEAGRLFRSCLFWQRWNICPHKTFSVQSISQFSMRQSFFFFARSVFNPSMLRTTRVPEDKPIQFAPKMYVACVVTLTTQQQSCTQKYLTQNTNNTDGKADGKKKMLRGWQAIKSGWKSFGKRMWILLMKLF